MSFVIVGTGYFGFMKILSETEKYLKTKGIEVIAEKNKRSL
jgi:hypothetical protein